MKKSITLIFTMLIIWSFGFAQNPWEDPGREKLAEAKTDTSRVLAMAEMCNVYKFDRPDSALYYGYNALSLARKIKYPKGEATALNILALTELTLGNYLKGYQLFLESGKIAKENNFSQAKALSVWGIGWYYFKVRDYKEAISMLKESYLLLDSGPDKSPPAIALYCIAESFLAMSQLDSALYYGQKAYDKINHDNKNWATKYILLNLGKLYSKLDSTNLALSYLRQSLSNTWETESQFSSCFAIAQFYQQTALQDSSIFYAKKSLKIAQDNGYYGYIIDANVMLSGIYEKIDVQQALIYSKKAVAYKDTLDKIIKRTTQKTITDFDEQERLRKMEEAKSEFQNRLRTNAFLGITFTLLVIAFFLYRNNRLKQQAKQNIERAYDQLKSTQSQLIQSEKMASLGELTAGIAHEIQNPLNFVNNFSEVNTELIDELEQEVDKGNLEEVKAIAKDIKDNEQKINHHGKRADAIVKGMLQHSRSSSGVKEPTDINKLADEYLRLAYHGLRAKDKSFNAAMKTDFDESIGNINIIPQDIGRVILNLITNAFYAVNEKNASTFRQAQSNPGSATKKYEPTVTVSTISSKSPSGDLGVKISVKDNGPGIPQKVLDKIFQPFFTTKPTGQGTGLGLSLAYDIVKAHGGELRVETKEGEGSEFIIQIPIN